MVFLRKRLTPDILGKINELICQAEKPKGKKDQQDPPSVGTSGLEPKLSVGDQNSKADGKNRGKLLLDATCAPADIRYPTDLSLLNEAREKLEEIIDTLHQPLVKTMKKPRTYRQKGRRAYLSIAKQKKSRARAIRKAIGQQLRFIRRNLRSVEKLKSQPGVGLLTSRQERNFVTIGLLYEQQNTMYRERSHSVSDRIVSIHQPHVRPIVRGKA